MTMVLKLVRLARSHVHELHSSWQLFSTVFSNHLLIRIALPSIGLALLPLAATNWIRVAIAVLIIVGEFIGRYLFFVTVVPTNMASGYLAQEAA
jgi:DMSO reductase anchor subunit